MMLSENGRTWSVVRICPLACAGQPKSQRGHPMVFAGREYLDRVARTNTEWLGSWERRKTLAIRINPIVCVAVAGIALAVLLLQRGLQTLQVFDPDDPTGNRSAAGFVTLACLVLTLWVNSLTTRHFRQIVGDRVYLQMSTELGRKRAGIDKNKNDKLDFLEIYTSIRGPQGRARSRKSLRRP
jgi:hypothetical protein